MTRPGAIHTMFPIFLPERLMGKLQHGSHNKVLVGRLNNLRRCSKLNNGLFPRLIKC